MNLLNKTALKIETLKDLIGFFWANKLWWLIPFILVLIIAGLLILFAQTSALAPFVYTLI